MPMTETRICDSTRSPAGGAPARPARPLGLLARVARLRQALPRQALRAGRHGDVLTSLRPLAVDVGVPLATFYLLHDAFGVSLWLSLALSSIPPAIRTVAGFAAERKANLLALLMLAVNLAGIVVSFLTGDPRGMIAKDSLVSSVIAIAILVSVAMRRPLMSAGLKPFMTKGQTGRTAAWERASRPTSGRFRRLELAVQHDLGPGAAGRVRRPPDRRLHAAGHHDGLAGHRLHSRRDRPGRGDRRRRRGPHPEDDRRRDPGVLTQACRSGRREDPAMRGKGINYDTGFSPAAASAAASISTRPSWAARCG